jgi:hypothetical protein
MAWNRKEPNEKRVGGRTAGWVRLNKIETNHLLKPENMLFVFLRPLLISPVQWGAANQERKKERMPLGVAHNLLKRLISEKEMEGNPRNVALIVFGYSYGYFDPAWKNFGREQNRFGSDQKERDGLVLEAF